MAGIDANLFHKLRKGAPCMLPESPFSLLGKVRRFIGEAVRSWRQAVLDLVCRAAPRLIAQHVEYPEADLSRRTSYHKAAPGKKCEVGEPMGIIPSRTENNR